MNLALAVLALAVPFAAATAVVRARAAEPPLRLVLRLDGADHELADGEEVAVTIAGKEVRARATVLPNRRFDAAGVRFDFPRDMAFAHDDGGALQQWTLDGDDCVLHLNAFGAGEAAELAADVLTGMLRHLQADAAAPQPCEVTLGGRAHAGLRGRAALVGASFEVTAVGLVANGKPFVLLLQDSLGDDGKASAEAQRILALLSATFALAK